MPGHGLLRVRRRGRIALLAALLLCLGCGAGPAQAPAAVQPPDADAGAPPDAPPADSLQDTATAADEAGAAADADEAAADEALADVDAVPEDAAAAELPAPADAEAGDVSDIAEITAEDAFVDAAAAGDACGADVACGTADAVAVPDAVDAMVAADADVAVPPTGYVPLDLLSQPLAAFTDVTADYGFAKYLPPKFVHAACTVGADLDGDGREDLAVVRQLWGASSLDVALLTDAGVTHVTTALPAAAQGTGVGCSVADMDDDGKLDILIGTTAGYVLMRNTSGGSFEDKTDTMLPAMMDFTAQSAAMADFDGDGVADLLIGAGDFYGKCGTFECQFSAVDLNCKSTGNIGVLDSMQDRMWQRNGLQWADVTGKWQLPAGGWRTMVTAVDLDQDGTMDALVGNDPGEHFLLRGEGGGLKKYETDIGLLGSGDTMGWAVGDIDGDGKLDVFMADAGPSPLYLQKKAPAGKPIFFQDESVAWGVAAATHDLAVWNPLLVDFDQDGWLDIYLGTSAVAPQGWLALVPCNSKNIQAVQADLLLHNLGGKGFEALRTPTPPGQTATFATLAETAVDIDGDGDLDVLQVRTGGALRVLRNDMAPPKTSIIVHVQGPPGNRLAVGTSMVAQVGPSGLLRRLTGTTGGGGAGRWNVHIGIGAAKQVDGLTVTWPNGATSAVPAVLAGGQVTIVAP